MLVDYNELGAGAISVSLERHMQYLGQMNRLMAEAQEIVYEHTRQWHDSQGEGTWARLSPKTVADKSRRGAANPSRILYDYGNLYASVTSATGPYSWTMPMLNGITFGVNWAPADYLNTGQRTNKGPNAIFGHPGMPGRSIWPPVHTATGMAMTREIGLLFLTGIRGGTFTARRFS